MCVRRKKKSKEKNMSLGEFKQIVEQFNPLTVTISGDGEPLLNPKIREFVLFLKSKRIKTILITNFVLAKKFLDFFAKEGPDIIRVSIDAGTPQTYKKIRNSNNFEKVVTNLKNLKKIKTHLNTKKPKIVFNVTILNENIRELNKIIILAENLGVSSIDFRPTNILSMGKKERKKFLKSFDIACFLESLKEANSFASNKRVRTNLNYLVNGGFEKFYNKKTDPSKCLYPWIQAVVKVDGSLSPCDKVGLAGNFFLNDSWDTKKFLSLRKSILSHNFTAACKKCRCARGFSDLVKRATLIGF
jgi:MoaA/NifB/PqqE/SkfB family radical SAM enzyme